MENLLKSYTEQNIKALNQVAKQLEQLNKNIEVLISLEEEKKANLQKPRLKNFLM